VAKYGLVKDIVLRGILRPAGMPSYPDLTDAEVEAIRAYLINQAWARYEHH
jgi:hypothetical protein